MTTNTQAATQAGGTDLDLDMLEAHARAAQQDEKFAYDFVVAFNPSVMLQLIALARRASPQPVAIEKCRGCDPAEGFCKDCREAERAAMATKHPSAASSAQIADARPDCRYCNGKGEHHQERGVYVDCESCEGTGKARGKAQIADDHAGDDLAYLYLSRELVAALKRLSFAAQTSGGTAGPDAELQVAIEQAQKALSLGAVVRAANAAEAAIQPPTAPVLDERAKFEARLSARFPSWDKARDATGDYLWSRAKEEWRAAQQAATCHAADHDEAVSLLAAVFDAWENGTECYEYPEESAGYLGMAFKLDNDIFDRCCSLLNRLNPPKNAAPTCQGGAQKAGDLGEPLGYITNDARGMLDAGRPITVAVSIKPDYRTVPIYAAPVPVAVEDARDAARYRWLRCDAMNPHLRWSPRIGEPCVGGLMYRYVRNEQEFDTALDERMASDRAAMSSVTAIGGKGGEHG